MAGRGAWRWRALATPIVVATPYPSARPSHVRQVSGYRGHCLFRHRCSDRFLQAVRASGTCPDRPLYTEVWLYRHAWQGGEQCCHVQTSVLTCLASPGAERQHGGHWPGNSCWWPGKSINLGGAPPPISQVPNSISGTGGDPPIQCKVTLLRGLLAPRQYTLPLLPLMDEPGGACLEVPPQCWLTRRGLSSPAN